MTHHFYLAAVLMSPPHALITPVTESSMEKGEKGRGVCTLLRMQLVLPNHTEAYQPRSLVISVAGTTLVTHLITFAFKAVDCPVMWNLINGPTIITHAHSLSLSISLPPAPEMEILHNIDRP